MKQNTEEAEGNSLVVTDQIIEAKTNLNALQAQTLMDIKELQEDGN